MLFLDLEHGTYPLGSGSVTLILDLKFWHTYNTYAFDVILS